MLIQKRGQNTVTSIYNELRRAIANGELAEGTQLKQAAIGEQFGVSKIPVREALMMLEADGFITQTAGKGATVMGLSAAEALEIYLIRMSLEPILLKDSVPNLSPLDLARADAILHTIDSMENLESQQWQMLDREFHHILYQAAPHERMKKLVSTMHDNLARYYTIYKTAGPDFRIKSDQEHHKILDACKKNDLDTACEILQQQMERSSSVLQKILKEKEKVG
ncbi:MAG: GntR family transcriptional regulator [Chloroflexota bacterium]